MSKKNTTTYFGLAIGFSSELLVLTWGFYKVGEYLVENRGWVAQSPAYLAVVGLFLSLVHIFVTLKRIAEREGPS